jgi:multidrug transporter EmrE-like cation transporter
MNLTLDAQPTAPPRLLQVLFIAVAVIAVAVADVFLKRATAQASLAAALRNPYFWGAVGLYLLQIVVFTYAMIAGWKLSVLGGLQTALYGAIVLGAGVLLYRETLSQVQILGLALALGGAALLNWSGD